MKFATVSDGIQALRDSVEGFSQHLKHVYELEMYYGDETLQALIEHARELSSSFEEYDEFYNLFDLGPVIEEEEEEDMEEPTDGAQTQE